MLADRPLPAPAGPPRPRETSPAEAPSPTVAGLATGRAPSRPVRPAPAVTAPRPRTGRRAPGPADAHHR